MRVIWRAGPQGGGWFDLACDLAAVIRAARPDLAIEVVAGGGRDNPASVEAGAADLAMSIDFLVAAAVRGAAPYDGPAMTGLATLGSGWSTLPFHLLKTRSAQPDFRRAIGGGGFRIAVPARDTADELTFQRVLAFYGASYDRLRDEGGTVLHDTYDGLVAAVREGRVDYLFGATTRPAAVIAAAGEGPCPVELVSMPDELVAHLAAAYGYGRGTIPAATYPGLQAGDVACTVMETVIVASPALAEDAAYGITRALLEHRHRLPGFDPAAAWRSPPAPLHPGAARAYRDLGFMR